MMLHRVILKTWGDSSRFDVYYVAPCGRKLVRGGYYGRVGVVIVGLKFVSGYFVSGYFTWDSFCFFPSTRNGLEVHG